MNLLILNGPRDPNRSPNLSYRGTYRMPPTYCNALPSDHELNTLFMWFLQEGGESGIVHDLSKACRLAELCNVHMPGKRFEVVEVTDGENPPATQGRFLGYDLSMGYGNSLLWFGLEHGPTWSDAVRPVDVLCCLIYLHFSDHLNENGLFPMLEVASFCLRSIVSLQSYNPDIFESGQYRVTGVQLVSCGRGYQESGAL